MQSKPLILALDIATNTGFCVGRAGERLRFGTWRLKDKDDEPKRAARNLGCRLRDEFMIEKPDIVIYEAAMSAGAMLQAGNASHTADLLWQLSGAVEGVCGPYGIRTRIAHVQQVRKQVLGKGRPEDPKRAVLAHCQALGFDVRDHNAADSIALHLFQSGYIHGELLLTATGSPA